MKKLLLCGCLVAGGCLVSVAQSKINNVGRIQLHQYNEMKAELSQTAPARAAALGEQTVNVFVTLNAGYTAADIEAWGVEVLDTTSDMAIVKLPIEKVEELAAQPFVKLIDFGREVAPMMDRARQFSFADAVHDGDASQGLTRAYKGNGVYVGLYDTGLDPNHVNFTDHAGNSRVKGVYLSRTSSGVSSYEGADVARFTTDDQGETHGTHVLGTIAGRDDITGRYAVAEGTNVSVVESGNIPYYGLAPEATILVGCGDFYNDAINAGIGAVIARAKADNKPVVVNLSLGHNRGSHDPNETVNRYLDSQAQDAIICVAAGNEGGSRMSIEASRTRGGYLTTTIVPNTEGATNATARLRYTAEVWANDNQAHTAYIFLWDKVKRERIAEKELTGTRGYETWNTSDNTFGQYFESGSSVSVSWGVDGSTGRFNISMDNTIQAKSADVVFGIDVEYAAGQRLNAYCDAYDGYSQDEVRFANQTGLGGQDGNDNGSINGMACGLKTISVGSWTSRTLVPQLGGRASGAGPVNDISAFSSHGRSGDGRMLPIVCAPGAQIISSISTYYADAHNMSESSYSALATVGSKKYPWYYMQGTSMATPFVTGTVALWLEAYPEMRSDEVVQILQETCTKDSYTNDLANADKWGYGKINVLAGLKKAITMSASVESVLEDEADKNLMIVNNGAKQLEISVPGVNDLSAALYNLQGAQVAVAQGSGDTLQLDGSALTDGIYVVTVDAAGQKLSRKVVLK